MTRWLTRLPASAPVLDGLLTCQITGSPVPVLPVPVLPVPVLMILAAPILRRLAPSSRIS